MRGTAWVSLAVGAALAAAASAGLAADAPAGKKLVEASCTGCHRTEPYTAADRKVNSLEGLKKQVAACAEAAGTGWTDAQKADVVAYLNREFYHFR